MEKVLLAIEGREIDKRVVKVAKELCSYVKAELNVLQLISLPMKKISRQAKRIRDYIEISAVAATFGEMGEHEKAKEIMLPPKEVKQILSEEPNERITYEVKVSSGNIEKDIEEYVHSHKDIILTIFNVSERKEKLREVSQKVQRLREKVGKKIFMPIIVINK